MLQGPKPAWLREKALRQKQNGESGKLMLVHGYCAAETPYSVEDFSDSLVFQDFGKNRNCDEFAQQVMDFGHEVDSFGIIAHSQGGLASLHLHAFYWSELENANGNRLIQSLASPYQGVPLAG